MGGKHTTSVGISRQRGRVDGINRDILVVEIVVAMTITQNLLVVEIVVATN